MYIWGEGISRGVRAERQRLWVLVVVGVNAHGENHLLAIEDGLRESTRSWREVWVALRARGLNPPEVAVGDGAMGCWMALEEISPTTQPQRCWVHKTVNVLNALPTSTQPKAKQALHDIWQAATRKEAERAFDRFLVTYEPQDPKATACLLKDREPLVTVYALPATHWQALRTTNQIESTFATIRHRTNRTNGCMTRDSLRPMMFKLGQCAAKR